MAPRLGLILLLLCGRAIAGPPQSADTTQLMELDRLTYESLRSDLAQAKNYAWRLVSLSKKLQNKTTLTSAWSALVIIHRSTGGLDSAHYYLKEYEAMAKSSGDPKMMAGYANSAGLFYRNTGRYKEALPFLLEALRLLGPDGDKTSRAGQMLNIGNNYYSLGELENASKYFIQSLALFEKIGNKRGQSFCFQGLGNTYKELNQYKQAEKYYLQSERLKEELGDKRGLLSAWMSLGALYQDMKQFDRALSYTSKGLAASRQIKNTDQVMNFLYNLASLMKSMNKPYEARKHYNESLELANDSGDTLLISRIKTDLIMLDGDEKKMVNDERELIEHVEIAIENGDRSVAAEGRHKLAEWYSRNGQFERAYSQIKLAHDLADSLRSAEIQKQIKKMEEEYLGEKKDREIALLKKDQELHSVELSRQNTMITAILTALLSVVVISLLLVNRYRVVNNAKRALEIERVRNNIARDLHDEMGSALSSINILSRVAMVEEEAVARQYLQNIGDQSEKMMENMGDMVWSINPRNDNIEKIIIRMREFASEILDAKDIEFTFTDNFPVDVSIGADKRKNLFLIFKEAVNNAAKYSGATRMEMGLAFENGSLLLVVRDNGVGFVENAEQAGNGLRNMRERAAESGGSLLIKSTPGAGTEIQLWIGIA